jgi:hypothetical protein
MAAGRRKPTTWEGPALLSSGNGNNNLPDGRRAVGQVFADGKERKVVNSVAAGPTYTGFRNELLNCRDWFKLTEFNGVARGPGSRRDGANSRSFPLHFGQHEASI